MFTGLTGSREGSSLGYYLRNYEFYGKLNIVRKPAYPWEKFNDAYDGPNNTETDWELRLKTSF